MCILYLADDVDIPIEPSLEEYIKTPAFDHQFSEKVREHTVLSSDESGGSDGDSLRFSNASDSISRATTVESTPYEVSKVEASLYYAGVGSQGYGPKLIYRTSDDKFEEPSGFEAYTRRMRLVPVPDSHEFGEDGMWDIVRNRVCGLLVTQQFLD